MEWNTEDRGIWKITLSTNQTVAQKWEVKELAVVQKHKIEIKFEK
jgi:hypothetical protein